MAIKLQDYRSKSTDDLNAELKVLRDELFKLTFQHATSQLDKTHRIPQVKRSIARVSTILRERELGAQG